MLEDLGKMHNIWVAMSLNLGVPPHMVEDLVQEMYLRIHKYITEKEKIYYQDKGINRFYIWTVLRNMWKSVQTLKSKNPIVSFSEYYGELEIDDTRSESIESIDLQQKKAYNKLLNKINQTVNEWDYWYDKSCLNCIITQICLCETFQRKQKYPLLQYLTVVRITSQK